VTTPAERLSAALADRYRIERELGAGGMATVYLAEDLKHDRKVAIKVLKPELSAVIGAERFLREIKTIASLQHPHILGLIDSGERDGTAFYVMPYVEGESLRDRLQREKQLPVPDAVRIAGEVASALDYAHRHGVIHRDIKPENILLHDGQALVADFGIALAVTTAGGTRMTETGMSLGTPHYMSPEQAMGEREITARSDVYSLGCVLYEMLVGEPPFTGPTAQAIVAKVMNERAAPIIPQRDRVPPHVEEAVLTALEKLPADRFGSAAEFSAALAANRLDTGARTTRARAAGDGSDRAAARNRVAAVALVVAALAGVAGWMLGQRAGAPPAPSSRLAIIEPNSSVFFNGIARTIAITPDGQTVIFAATHAIGGSQLLMRRLDGSASVPVPNSTNAAQIRVAPDGRTLYASFAGAPMQRMPITGGTWTPVPHAVGTPFFAFGEEGTIYWGRPLGNETHRVGPDGRDTVMFSAATLQQVLPGGRHALGVRYGTAQNFGTAVVLDLRSGAIETLIDGPVSDIRYTQGYLVYVRTDNTMMAVPFDPDTRRLAGEPVEIANDVTVSGAGFAQFAVAENGTVAYVPGFASDLVSVIRAGDLRVLIEERQRYHSPRVSPDGRRVAVDIVRLDGRDVWFLTEGSRELVRATFTRDGHDPVWSPDGKGFYYTAAKGDRLGVFFAQPGTTAEPRDVAAAAELSYTGTPIGDGSGLLTEAAAGDGRGSDIVRILSGSGRVDTLLATPADESYAVPSPDGRWFAYISDRSGRAELYLRSLRGGDVQLQLSDDGASEPVWSRDGREIFYRRPTPGGAGLVALSLQFAPAPRVIGRTPLFDVSGFDTGTPHANYDVAPDGRSFVFVRPRGATYVMVLQNVPELARRLAREAAAR